MSTKTTTIDAASTIREVTVYESRAQVHRHATVALAEGLNAVVLADLPKNIDRDALQVGFLEGADGVVLRGIQFDTRTTANPAYATEMAARDSAAGAVERLRRELQTAVDDADAVRQRQTATAKLAERAVSADSGAGPAVFDPATWTSIVGAHATRVQAELAEQRVLEDKLTTLRAELADAERRQRVAVPKDLTQSVVTVLLSARAAVVKAVLAVSYLVDGASWEPEYEVRVKSETLQMAVHYHGVVRQTTEEDWTGVRVSLSTARPTISGRQPEMTPWRVGIYVAPPPCDDGVRMFSKQKKSSRGSMAMASSLSMQEECEDRVLYSLQREYRAPQIETAAVQEAATSVSFGVARPMTVLRDGEAVRAALVTLELGVTLTHVTAPSALEAVFATAKATNTSEVPLAAGAASVFLDGQFVTRSTLPRTPIGEELRVSVGRDEGVTVRRKMLNKKRSDEGGMFSGRRDLVTHTFVTTLKNGRRQAVEVLVQERVPCSDSDDLVVTLVRPAPASLSEEQQTKLRDDGILEKLVKVAPNATADYELEFTVSAPEGKHIYGM